MISDNVKTQKYQCFNSLWKIFFFKKSQWRGQIDPPFHPLAIWLTVSINREATDLYQLITNNHTFLQMWLKEKLLNHRKVSNNCEHDCLQNFLFVFMSLLTAFVNKILFINRVWKFGQNWAGSYFTILNIHPRLNLKDFQYRISVLVNR